MAFNPTKTDPRTIRTRNLIQDAFLSLSTEKNFESITVKDIAERASINRATFYAHFEDKYELLNCILDDTFAETVSSKLHLKSNSTEANLENLILVLCDYHESINTHCKRVYISAAPLIDAKVQLILKDIVHNILESSTLFLIDDPNKFELVTTMVGSLIYSSTKYCYSKDNLKGISTLNKEILPFILAGLKTTVEKR